MRPLFHAALPRVLLKERGSGASRVSVYNMKKIGFIGWRGMVGSVLMNRMVEEHDFVGFESHFFSTSQAGQKAPDFAGTDCGVLLDAGNLDLLKEMDIIVTCQGGGYTTSVYDKLLASGWKGYWIDSASTLRQDPRACIILDPVNREVIDRDLERGIHTFVGGNCTTSIMLMALAGLIKSGAVEWLQMSSYQAASGAGAKNMRELLAQMGVLYGACAEDLKDPSASILKIKKDTIREALMDFEAVEHRLEFVREVDGVRWVNDSKATNVNSTWYALESMKTPTVLILGGKDKGNDYSEIEELVSEKVRAIVCMGKDNAKLLDFFGGKVKEIRDTHSLEDAVAACREPAQKGDTGLLSPCCASFDLFSSYDNRGDTFKAAVRALKEKNAD